MGERCRSFATEVARCTITGLALLLAGCAAPLPEVPAPNYTVVAHTGKVVGRVAVPTTYGNAGSSTYVPIYTGKGVVPLLIPGGLFAPSSPGFYIYEIAVADTDVRSVKVASRGEIPDGTCVDVMVVASKPKTDAYPTGEAALRQSDNCKS